MVEALSEFASWLLSLVVDVIEALFTMASDVVCWVADQVLTIVDGIIAAADVGTLQQYDVASYIGTMPPDLLNVLGLVGVGECAAIISAAVTVRVLLRFVPFF